MTRYTKQELQELKSVTGIIYLVRNTKNKRCYVGQTVKTFNQRYCGAGNGVKRMIGNTNKELESDIKKYGVSNFKVTLLEKWIDDINVLNEKEDYYIELYECRTKGYNTRKGGGNTQQPMMEKEFYETRREIKELYLDLLVLNEAYNGTLNKSKRGSRYHISIAEVKTTTNDLVYAVANDGSNEDEYNKQQIKYHINSIEKEIDDKMMLLNQLSDYVLILDDILELYGLN